MSDSTIKDGGPAFPARPDEHLYSGSTITANHGMTLRDYFAAKAITGTLPGRSYRDEEFDAYAQQAYKMADAMLRARGAA